MSGIADLFDIAPKLESYLKEHFDGVATAWLYEPFSRDPKEPNGLTVVLNRETEEGEKRWLRTEFEGMKMRWQTPSQKFSLPPKVSASLAVTLKPEKPGA